MLFVPVSNEVALTKNVYNGAVIVDKVIQKTEEGTWGDSLHEESYQGLKDFILKVGGLN